METYLFNGLLLGLASSLHCIGMCGPIAMAVPVNRKNNFSIFRDLMQYNLGRIVTYMIFGFVVGSIGFSVASFGILQIISILSGAFLILFAWRKWLNTSLHPKIPRINISGFVSQKMGKILRSKNPLKLSLLGFLNGLLPCGMVYVALLNALLAGNPWSSAFSMVTFGLGTLPAMLIVGFAARKITGKWRTKLNAGVPYLLTLVGVLIILRGMNLGIPLVSPKANITSEQKNSDQNSKKTIQMDCCHATKNECED